MSSTNGKLRDKDEMLARLWKWLPWFCLFVCTLPAPIGFLILFLLSTSTDSAAVYLALSFLSLGLGAFLGLVVVFLIAYFRRRWFRRLRDRLAEDGITAGEVSWFTSELTRAERQALSQIQQHNPLLADAYCETLASRLTATRLIKRARNESLQVERRIVRARTLTGADSAALLDDLDADHRRLEKLRSEANTRLAEAKTRLQVIEAAANRSLTTNETNLMLARLAESQKHYPLTIEMERLEQQLLGQTAQETSSRYQAADVPARTPE
jgi:hypothetical protein